MVLVVEVVEVVVVFNPDLIGLGVVVVVVVVSVETFLSLQITFRL